jgi:hypothetical protein
LVTISQDDHLIFERALKQLSRNSTLSQKMGVIHPYPLGLLLQSLVDHYRIPNYVFFLFASQTKQFSFCEGLDASEIRRAASVATDRPLDLNRSRSWASEVSRIFKAREPLFGNWSDAGLVRGHLEQNRVLTCELKKPATRGQCGRFWALQNRIFWADASSYARAAQLDQATSATDPTNEQILADTKDSYQQFCDGQLGFSEAYCDGLKNYIAYLEQASAQVEPSLYLRRFLANASAVVLDAVKAVIVPDVPSFETSLPDKFVFNISVITDHPDRPLNLSTVTAALKSFIPEGTDVQFETAVVPLIDLPFLALEFSRFEESGKFRTSNTIREGLQTRQATHKLQGWLNSTTRTINLAIVVYDVPPFFQNQSTSFAFDNVALAFTNASSFDPRPLLRSALVHLYGLPPSRRWHSLSILSPASAHAELAAVSRDAAVRNSVRVELSKTRAKIAKRIADVVEFVSFARENPDLAVSDAGLRAHAAGVRSLVSEVIETTSALRFDRVLPVLRAMRSGRRAFSRQAKQALREMQDQVCQFAPVHAIVAAPSLADRIDRIATLTAVGWLGLPGISGIVLLLAIRRNLKRD